MEKIRKTPENIVEALYKTNGKTKINEKEIKYNYVLLQDFSNIKNANASFIVYYIGDGGIFHEAKSTMSEVTNAINQGVNSKGVNVEKKRSYEKRSNREYSKKINPREWVTEDLTEKDLTQSLEDSREWFPEYRK